MASDLDEQIAYYRARAPEYDEWWERQGRFDRGEEANRAWFAEIAEVEAAFDQLDLGDHALELASGTGFWTAKLAARTVSVTAVDASPEMIDEARSRLGDAADDVDFRIADLFAWEPDEQWDACVFCFFISHIPSERLDGFLGMVRSALRPGGSVFFLDGRRTDTSTAVDHVLPENEETMTRRLNDGREFTIYKNFWPADDLMARCEQAGLMVDVRETAGYFQYGLGRAV